MKFQINDQITYDGLSGIITGFHKETCNYENVFEAEIKLEDSVKYLLFDKDGYVKPFTHNSNQPKVLKQTGSYVAPPLSHREPDYLTKTTKEQI